MTVWNTPFMIARYGEAVAFENDDAAVDARLRELTKYQGYMLSEMWVCWFIPGMLGTSEVLNGCAKASDWVRMYPHATEPVSLKEGDIRRIRRASGVYVAHVLEVRGHEAMVKIESAPGKVEYYGTVTRGTVAWNDIERGELIDGI